MHARYYPKDLPTKYYDFLTNYQRSTFKWIFYNNHKFNKYLRHTNA